MPTPALKQELEFIEAHPQLHEQDVWINLASGEINCGTTACLAGWAVIHHDPEAAVRWVAAEWSIQQDFDRGQFRGSPEGHYFRSIQAKAREVFGITPDQAEVLFSDRRTVSGLRAGVEAVYADPDIGYRDLLREVLGVEQQHFEAAETTDY